MLLAESQQVIGLRLWKIALSGPAAGHEVNLMISEKAMAAGEAAQMMMSGKSVDSVIRNYRRKVGANARRLRRG